MTKRDPQSREEQAQRRIAELCDRIGNLDYVCSGTLLRRMMKCGKPSCRCHSDPEARHGPYFDWTRRERGRLVHALLTREEAAFVQNAIKNQRTILRLLRTWERETRRVMEARSRRNQ